MILQPVSIKILFSQHFSYFYCVHLLESMSGELKTVELVAITMTLEKDEDQVKKNRMHGVYLMDMKRKRKGQFHLIYEN